MHNAIKKFRNTHWVIKTIEIIIVAILPIWFNWYFKWCEPKEPPEIGSTIHVGAHPQEKALAHKIVNYLKQDTSIKKHIPKDVIWISDPLAIDTIYCTPKSAKDVAGIINSLQGSGEITINAIYPSERHYKQNIIIITHNNNNPRDNQPITEEEIRNIDALCTKKK